MAEREQHTPWADIQELLAAGQTEPLRAYVETLSPPDFARAATRLDEEDTQMVLALIGPERAADFIEAMSDVQAADILEELPVEQAAAIVDEMESDHRADLLSEMDAEDAEAILQQMDPEEAEDARHLLKYHEDSAGGTMVTEFVSYPQDTLVGAVLEDLQENAEQYADIGIHYVYVESPRGVLVGVARLRDLVLASHHKLLQDIMIVNPIYVLANTPLQELDTFFERYSFSDVPVTDHEGKMLGLVRRADVEQAVGEERERALMRYGGHIGGEELRSMPVRERATMRLVWLFLNMALSIGAASVILGHQDTVNQLFALVFFMPIICNMSGCSGNQAVAVSIRELTLGLIKPRDYARVWMQEVSVGVMNGVVLGAIIGIVADTFWRETPMLGVIIGVAFTLNVLIAVSLGGLIPLALKALRLDPALGAPPILTTLTDMCGFLLVLTLAQYSLKFGLL